MLLIKTLDSALSAHATSMISDRMSTFMIIIATEISATKAIVTRVK